MYDLLALLRATGYSPFSGWMAKRKFDISDLAIDLLQKIRARPERGDPEREQQHWSLPPLREAPSGVEEQAGNEQVDSEDETVVASENAVDEYNTRACDGPRSVSERDAQVDLDETADTNGSVLRRGASTTIQPMTDVCPPADGYFTVSFKHKSGSRRGPRNHFKRTSLALSKGVKPWQELERLQYVEHASEEYHLGDLVYIYTGEKADSTARIWDIRATGDSEGRKEICVSWLWTKQEAKKEFVDTSEWPGDTTHIDSNWLQVLPWDTINGHPIKADVRASPWKVLDACSKEHKIHSCDDPAVQWMFRLQSALK